MPRRGTLVSFGCFKKLAPMRWFASLSASDLEREQFGPVVSAEQSSSHATIVPRLFHVEHFTRTALFGDGSQGALLLRYSASTNPGGTQQGG